MGYELTDDDAGYVFDLHLMCGGYAYYSTYTGWVRWGSNGREVRRATVVKLINFTDLLTALGREARFLDGEVDYHSWLRFKGWAMVPVGMAQAVMPQWLKARECIHSSTGTFTDTDICSPNALNHHASQGKREAVLRRDGERCILCSKTPADGVSLTMQHVRPFSKGGETTTRNLVALCEACNNGLGDAQHDVLYEMAGLPHGCDLGLFNGKPLTELSFRQVMRLSSNLMHTRCEVW